ncbi:MAG TPA: S8 family serine peptidase [Solirubrobacteraceae bacterium]|jgi:hypothetical protein
MNGSRRGLLLASWLAIAAGLLTIVPTLATAATVAPLPASDYGARHVCHTAAPDRANCLALELVPETEAAIERTHPLGMTLRVPAGAAGAATSCESPVAANDCYGLRPEDLKDAYFPGENALAPEDNGKSQTIALVDAYNDLNAEEDLETYSEEFTPTLPLLHACKPGEEAACFEKVNQDDGKGELPFPEDAQEAKEAREACVERPEDTAEPVKEWEIREAACELVEEAEGWSLETSLDIEMAHAVCQNCKILLVEADSDEYADLIAAEQTAVAHAQEISNSWGGEEEPKLLQAFRGAFDQPGKVITASSGDEGYLNWAEAEEAKFFREPYYVGADLPASLPSVVAVGGTKLEFSGGKWQGETVWNEDHDPEEPNYGAGGSGCSTYFEAPEWQRDLADWAAVGCNDERSVADVAADADPYTGVAVYDSSLFCEYKYTAGGRRYLVRSHWCTVGGTSVASPIVASMFALAGGADGVEYPAKTLYEHLETRLLHRVSSGGNGECDDDYASGCSGSLDPQSARFPFDCGEGELICNVGPGCAGWYYDGPAGVGTPDGIAAFEPQVSAPKEAPACPNEEKTGEQTGEGTEGGTPPAGQGEVKAPVGEPQGKQLGGKAKAATSVKPQALALTRRATAALSLRGPLARQVTFTFKLSAAARVEVSLAIQVRSAGRSRWRKLPYSVAFFARKGRSSHSLVSRHRLASGRYRLTVSLRDGGSSSIELRVG